MANIIAVISRTARECHSGCAICRQIGRCVMSEEQILTRVIHGGCVRAEDYARIEKNG
jgi:hypothetical protein